MPFEIERKYLIHRPSETLLRSLPQADPTEITQTYLQADESASRMRASASASSWRTRSRKHSISRF